MSQPLLNVPTRIETERLYLRCFQPGDGEWYYAASQRNHAHLMRYESDNVVMNIKDAQEAESIVRELAAEWAAGRCFFMAAVDKQTNEFVAQIYVGPVNWDLPEFQIGYFVDRDREGYGYVTEAVQAALRFCFEHLKAYRVRLECDDTNIRSYRVAERCGMVREGHIREHRRNPDGTYSGTLYFGLLKREFEAQRV